MNETIEIEFADNSMVLSLSQEDFDKIGAESEEFLQNLIQSKPSENLGSEHGREAVLAWANKAFAAMWAAAYHGHKSFAESIDLRCELNGRHWIDSEIPFPYPCPVCFELNDCGHEVYRANSDCLAEELPGGEQLQNIDERIEECDLSAKKQAKIKKIPEIAAIMENAEDSKPWFLGLECARELRSFSVACDVDRWGDTLFLGYHPDPKKFLADLEALEQSIIEKISAFGIDLDDV
ncbi:MAG: hypothetical protein RLZZ224_1612 [Verrucomicrobiota bacterium]